MNKEEKQKLLNKTLKPFEKKLKNIKEVCPFTIMQANEIRKNIHRIKKSFRNV